MGIENVESLLEKTKERLLQQYPEDKTDIEDLFSTFLGVLKVENNYIYVIVPDALTQFQAVKFHSDRMNKVLESLCEEKHHFKFITKEDADEDTKKKENVWQDPQPAEPGDIRGVRKLRPEFTFSSFVVGKSNRYAYLSAMNVAENPTAGLNPLYLFGDVGLGKTHLMMAIGHFVLDNNINANVIYTTAQQFAENYFYYTNDKSRQNLIESFYDYYSKADYLLVDDIQYLEGKVKTQDEFFKIFEKLHEENRQIIITSDRMASELKLMERLKSRFSWGVMADIKQPNLSLRISILRSKTAAMLSNPQDVPQPVLEKIAEMFTSNIRELEGAIRRYITYCVSLDLPFTVENVDVALEGILPRNKASAETKEVIYVKEIISNYFQIPISDLESSSRKSNVVYARNLAFYLIRERLDLSLKKIGTFFGNRDHATVSHGFYKIKEAVDSDSSVRNDINYITNKLKTANKQE